MAADQGPVVSSALLRSQLVHFRKDRGLTQEQVAGRLEWSPSKLIRVEGGRSSLTKVDLDALLAVYGVTSESSRERLAVLNRGTREHGWWEAYRNDIDPTYLNYVGYEAGAAFIRQFAGLALPALLQTREYAEVITEKTGSPALRDRVVQLRMSRQSELRKRSVPPRQYYVLGEGELRRHIGIQKDPAIMPNQLRSIAERASSDEHVTVRVMPFSTGAHAGLSGPFTLLEFDGGLPDILYLDTGAGPIFMIAGDDPQIAAHADRFETILEEALPADQSIEFIRRVAEEMQS
jgi:transcriptional regulator with XRE-family HTH domain